jgi:anti-anti-sigma factor
MSVFQTSLSSSDHHGPVLWAHSVSSQPVAYVAAGGELDHESAPRLTSTARSALGDGAFRASRLVVLDLAAIRFFGAAGVSALLSIHELATGAGGRLMLRDPSPATLRILRLVDVLDRFELHFTDGRPPP